MTYERYGNRCTVAAGTSTPPGSAGVKDAEAVARGVDEPLTALSESGLHAPPGLGDQIRD